MSEPIERVTLSIDGKNVEADPGTLIIRAAEAAGVHIPRFCDHPLLDPVGACRQCVVEVEGQRKPVMSCTMPVEPDMVVSTQHTSDVAARAQESALEFLLINHPLDCPMCDKGGECPLQDQALEHGPGESRFVDDKRRYSKAVSVSPLVLLDRERCVLCARCTRFSEQISGDPFIELFERGALEQVAVFEDEPYESAFSGNVIQICPVGALTSTDYRFKARPFDVRTSSSACTHCASNCSMTVQSRAGTVTRQLAKTNMAVNEAWNCDRGRFGFTAVQHESRLLAPVRNGDETTWSDATAAIADALEATSPDRVGIIHGGRLANEDAWVLSRFARDIVGTDRIHMGPSPVFDAPEILSAYAGSTPAAPEDIDRASTVVVVGLDPRDEAGVLYLRLRKAWRDRKAKLVAVGPRPGSLAELAWRVLPTAPESEGAALDSLAGSGSDYSHPHLDDVRAAVEQDPNAVILVGERAGAESLAAAGRMAAALDASVGFVPSRGNVMGALRAGAVAGLLPGGRLASDGTDRQQVAWAWNDKLPEATAASLDDTLHAAAAGNIDVLLIAGMDLVTHHRNPQLVREAMNKSGLTVVVDLVRNATTEQANIVLPAQAPQERAGTTTSWFGLEQRFQPGVAPVGQSLPDWQIFLQLTALVGRDMGVRDLESIRATAAELGPRPAPHAWPAAIGSSASEANEHPQLVTHRALTGPASMLAGADSLLAAAPEPRIEMHPATAQKYGVTDGEKITVTAVADTDRTVTRRAHVHRMILPGVVFTTHGVGSEVLPAGPVTLSVDGSTSTDQPDEPAKVAAHG